MAARAHCPKPSFNYLAHCLRSWVGVLIFFALYFGLMLLCVAGLLTCALGGLSLGWGIPCALACALLLAFLSFPILRPSPSEPGREIELREQQHPQLFALVHAMCRDLGCTPPLGISVNADVNACIELEVSLPSLLSPRRRLVLGAGLVRHLEALELKALLAHELGHCIQPGSRLIILISIARRITQDLADLPDRLDGTIAALAARTATYPFAWALRKLIAAMRVVVIGAFALVVQGDRERRRLAERHADAVAAHVAGQNALLQMRIKGDQADECMASDRSHLAPRDDQVVVPRG